MPGLRGVEHIGLTVPDLEAAGRWLVEVLGAEPTDAAGEVADPGTVERVLGAGPGNRCRWRFFRLGRGFAVELLEYDRGGGTTPANHEAGGHHLALEVEDVHVAAAHLAARGVTVPDAPEPGPDSGAWLYFRAPWGLQIELVERAPALRHTRNAAARPTLDAAAREALPPEGHERAFAEIAAWPGYAPTPLRPLPGLARAAGVASVLYKDEAHRFGLASFKALGGAYAVLHVLQQHLEGRGVRAGAAEIASGAHRGETLGVTVCCATDGNHGRSVAWGARTFGARAHIYIHEGVSADREAAIAAYGAEMVRVPGDYDASVRACARDAEAEGWTLVADTDAGGGSPEIPRLVVQGYTILVREILDQLEEPPTHVLVPAGVGGLAAAVAGHWAQRRGEARPRTVSVEPHSAACVLRALAEGAPRALEGDVDSFMACLSAGEVSPSAWPVLRAVLDDAVSIPDAAARDAMRGLALGRWGDVPLVSGESGCASVAGLLAAASDPAAREALGLGAHARVVLIGSEGATAPEIWRGVVGLDPEAVG